MNKAIYLFVLCPAIIFLSAHNSFSQLKNRGNLKLIENSFFTKNSNAETGTTLILGSILILTPTLVIEGGKSHFGLSKEFSIGKFPYGRAELDYTYIFRSERTSAVHLSYNLDIPFNGSFRKPSLFMFSPGAGYYTDFTRKGFFAQLAIGFWAGTGFSDAIAIHPNLKIRNVFKNDNYSNIFEISLGVGFGIYSQ